MMRHPEPILSSNNDQLRDFRAQRSRLPGVVATAVLTLAFGSIAKAQVLDDPGLRVVPVTGAATAGAGESIWTTEVFAHNHSDEDMWISAASECYLSAVHACDAHIPARSTSSLGSGRGTRYNWWYVAEGDPEALTMSAYVRNIGNSVDPWGTAIPIVSAGDFHTQPLHISPVPADPAYRISLRVLAVDESTTPAVPVGELEVTVQILDQYGFPVAESATMRIPPHQDDPEFDEQAPLYGTTYFVMHDLMRELFTADDSTRVRIAISAPDRPDARIWAMASITHNETHHVTIFAP